MDIEQLKENWIERGFSFNKGNFKKGGLIAEAFHIESDEVVFLDKGECLYKLGDKEFTHNGEEEVLIPMKTTHWIKNLSGKDLTIYYGYRLMIINNGSML